MGCVIHHFPLDEERVQRLVSCGVSSISDLVRVLAALDLKARIELDEVEPSRDKQIPSEEVSRARA